MVKRLARGVAEPAHRPRHRAAALLDGLDGYSLLLFRVAWYLGTPNRTDSVQLFVRIPKMSEFLAKSGVSPNRIIDLELFDYLTEPPCRDQIQPSKNVSVAGNLTEKKAGYLYSLPKELKDSSLHFDLFGNGYSCESSEGISYRGSVDPAELPALLPSGFGLVWDGPSADCCAGVYGTYLKFNNPHKLSLYYASGLIPVVWEHSAAARFVRSTDSGITVSRIKDLPQAINSLSPEEYKDLVGNAAEIGNKVRAGFYLRRATGEVLSQM